MTQLSEQTIEQLKVLAKREVWSDEDDLLVYDYCGGNVDDAYDGGERAGETNLAREILTTLDIHY